MNRIRMDMTQNRLSEKIEDSRTGDKCIRESYTGRELQELFASGRIRKDHPLQRKPDQWGKSEKDGLIASVIKGEDIGAVKLCEQQIGQETVLWLIDGVQRISVLEEYKNGSFPLGREIEEPVIAYQQQGFAAEGRVQEEIEGEYGREIVNYDLRGKGYQDLPAELKERFERFPVEVVRHLNCSEEEIGYHIRRYNRQKPMNTAQNVMTYLDSAAKEVKRISLHNRFFKDCGTYSAKERNNGTIERIIIESVMGMFYLKQWQKQSKRMGAYLNQHAGREEFEQLNQNLHDLEQMVRTHTELRVLFTSKHSFLWFTLYHRFLKKYTKAHREKEAFSAFLTAFQKGELTHTKKGKQFFDLDYQKAAREKEAVVKKLSLLERMLDEFLSTEIRNTAKSRDEDFSE